MIFWIQPFPMLNRHGDARNIAHDPAWQHQQRDLLLNYSAYMQDHYKNWRKNDAIRRIKNMPFFRGRNER